MRAFVDARHPAAAPIAAAASSVARGGVIIYPTETFYGIGASAFDRAACDRVFEMKGRPKERALPCIVGTLSDLARIARPSALAGRVAEAFWPGPLTLVLPAADGVVAVDSGTVAVRLSSHAVAAELARRAGPLTSTSANRSGDPASSRIESIAEDVRAAADWILDAGATPGGPASTIVDATGDAPRLLREGAVDFAAVVAAWES